MYYNLPLDESKDKYFTFMFCCEEFLLFVIEIKLLRNPKIHESNFFTFLCRRVCYRLELRVEKKFLI